MFDVTLGLFLFLSPIFFLPQQVGNINALQFYQFGTIGNGDYNFLQLQFFCYGTILLFITALLSQQRRFFKDRWVVILLALFCLSVFCHPITIKSFSVIFFGFLLYFLTVTFTCNFRDIIKVIVVISIVNFVFSVLQNFNVHLIYKSTGRIDGLMCLSTHLGVYQLIALPICYVFNPWLMVFPVLTIFLSKSIAAILLMFGWFLVMFWKKIFAQGMVVFMLILSLMFGFTIHNWDLISKKLQIRLMVWIPALEMIYKKLFLGYGVVSFRFNSPIGLYENPCSIYVETAFYLGIIGLAALALCLKNKLSNFISQDKHSTAIYSSCVLFLLSGIEKSFIDYPRLCATAIILFAFLTIAKGEIHVDTV